MKKICIFLDWSATVSGLIVDGSINTKKFGEFLNCLEAIEKAHDGKVELFIVSGTTETSANKRHTLLKSAFNEAGRSDIYQGFAYEYGGYFLDLNGKITCVNETQLCKDSKDNILQIAKKYNLDANPEYNLYLNFDGEGADKKSFYNFFKECSSLDNLSIVYYDDKEGIGCDFKNPKLNKGAFVKWYLQNNHTDIVIVGGDDKEDLSMIVNTNVIFVGFKSSTYDNKKIAGATLSEFDNIDGIIDDLKKITRMDNKPKS